MLEEDHRIVATQCAAQESDGIFCVGRNRNLPARRVNELDFIGLAMPGVTAFEEPAWDTNDHRSSEAVVGTPTHGAAVVDLLNCWIGILAELDFRNRHQAGHCHTYRPADDPFLREAGIKHPAVAEFVLQAQGHCMHTTFRADVLTEDQNARIDLQLVLERAANRSHHVDALSFRAGDVSANRGTIAFRPLTSTLLQLGLEEDVLSDPRRLADRACLRCNSRGFNGNIGFCLDGVPVRGTHPLGNQVIPQLGQRISRPLTFYKIRGLVSLGVLEAVSL
ncbi:hypothetical protein D9M68_539090 [compost metagenome]